jgi:metal-responsive CopG/Arc/MetJ family transcriptional regulator
VISISVEQSLLQKADLAARRAGISRAALFAMGLKSLLETGGKLAG